jgi:phosphoglycolate phosphatase-like HAD superfamily hydrolase
VFDANRVQAILFDIDGTLADSDDAMVEAVAQRLSWLPWADPRAVARRLVMAFETPVNSAITLLDWLGLMQRGKSPARSGLGRQGRRAGLPDFRVVAGVPSMLEQLAERYPLAVVTTRRRRDAEAFLEQHGLAECFSALVTRGSTHRLKPHPSPIERAANELAVPVGRCAMVGDTTPDVVAARRAGALAIGVLCGYGEREELERAGAHAVLEHVSLLPALLQPALARTVGDSPTAEPSDADRCDADV